MVLLATTLLAHGNRAFSQPPPTACGLPLQEITAQIEEAANRLHGPGTLQGRDLQESLIAFCRGACCLSPQGQPEEINISLFGEARYLPYSYLGWIHFEAGDDCSALRFFNLSFCEREGETDDERKLPKDLLVMKAMQIEAESRRPRKLPSFDEGYAAYKTAEWQRAVNRLAQSIREWDEDGSPARPQGRWFDWYLPRHYLARALSELDCLREAAALMGTSPLSACNRWKKSEKRQEMREIHDAVLERWKTAGNQSEKGRCRLAEKERRRIESILAEWRAQIEADTPDLYSTCDECDVWQWLLEEAQKVPCAGCLQ